MTALFRIVLFLVVGGSLLIGSNALAQAEATVRAVLKPAQVKPGQAAQFHIVVEGVRGGIPAPHIAADGLQFLYRGTEMEAVRDLSGAVRSQTTFSYDAIGVAPGVHEIPAVEVQSPQGVLTTEPVTLTVAQPSLDPPRATTAPPRSPFEPFLQIELGKDEFYVGEVVPVEVVLISSFRTQLDRPELPVVEQDGFAFRRFPPRAEPGQVTIDGERYRTWTFRSQFSALRQGDTELGPVKMNVEVLIPTTRSVSIFQRSERRSFSLESPTVKVKAKPLPVPGRPEDFTGVVGQFTLTPKTAAPRDLHVGDPINIILTIEGNGNFGAISAPKMEKSDGWRLYEPQTYEEADRLTLGANRTAFSQVIVPQEVRTEIPAFRFPYFDPTTEKYVTLRTEPTPIAIQPRKGGGGASAIASSGEGTVAGSDTPVPPAGETPVAEMRDILHIVGNARWDRNPAPPIHRRFVFLAPFFLALASLLLVFFAPILRVLQGRSARPDEGPDHGELVAQLRDRGLNDSDFLQRAREVIKNSPEAVGTGIANEIESRYASARFGGAEVFLDESERNRIVNELGSLVNA